MSVSSNIILFGVHVDGLSVEDVLRRIDEDDHANPFWIVTVNPEILLYARSHPEYRNAINRADLCIADGVGIQMIAALTGKRVQRVTGVDIAERLIARSAKQGEPVCLLGGSDDTALRALTALKQRHLDLIGQTMQGGAVSEAGAGDEVNDEAFHQITLMAPKLLLVAFGHPKQEIWIASHINDIPSVEVVIGIGGAFDYWSGNVPRAPQWMRSLGLEWLHRLVTQPKRWRRIWNAIVTFPALCIFDAVFPKSK